MFSIGATGTRVKHGGDETINISLILENLAHIALQVLAIASVIKSKAAISPMSAVGYAQSQLTCLRQVRMSEASRSCRMTSATGE
jgi:hypothetical protein